MAGNTNKDPLLSNKVAAAVLIAALLIFGLPQLTAAIFGGGGHHGGEAEELHLAYCCVELETGAAADNVEEAPPDLGTLMANASVAGGERRAALCRSCHTFDEGGANGAGPNLWDIVNRPVGDVAGFNYSSAIREFGGVWTYERLDGYIKNSQEYMPGTAMVQRFPRDDQRADILAYLGSLSPNPAPYPEPAIVATEEETVLEEATGAVEDGAEAVVDFVEDAAETVVDAAEEVAEEVVDAVDGED